MRATLFAVAVSLFLAGCANLVTPSCPAGLKPMTEAGVYFGRNIGAAPAVTDQDWQRFLDEEVTPRFPQGLTVEDAAGQWKGADGVVREASKHLIIVLSGAPDEADKLAAIREAYKRRFRQESVLLLETKSCGSF
jgi:hypothetical protein